jgi:tRNA U34 5-methylaminomethyl-2-thiouridine-forming methyltransferase MnmC
MSLKLTTTQDGSHSLLNSELQEHYHSQHGALRESIHVFIKMGLAATAVNPISILEYGFGTGLNALLTFMEADVTKRNINYHSLENTPLPSDIWKSLNYGEQTNEQERFNKLHECDWNTWVDVSEHFRLHKQQVTFEDFEPQVGQYDLIYFDAFAPRYHPEAWEEENVGKCYRALKPGGIWVSYCAQGAVRRRLQALGFQVERVEGPPGKREMLRGVKS